MVRSAVILFSGLATLIGSAAGEPTCMAEFASVKMLPEAGALLSCKADDECSLGRTCVRGRCEGFHGDQQIDCLPGEICKQTLSGHFEEGHTYAVQVVPGGMGCDFASQKGSFMSQRAPCVVTGEGTCALELGTQSQKGLFELCACPASNTGGDGIPCTELDEFPLRVGTLRVRGFGGVASSDRGSLPVSVECTTGKICIVKERQVPAVASDETFRVRVTTGDKQCDAATASESQSVMARVFGRSVGDSLQCSAPTGTGCGVHLGVPSSPGAVRLCGCVGPDCDESEDAYDFSTELGVVTVVGKEVEVGTRGMGEEFLSYSRRLQETNETTTTTTTASLINDLRCDFDSQCIAGYGLCRDGFCIGFAPDENDANIIPCVDGYLCNVAPEWLPAVGINQNFRTRTINPAGTCGDDAALPVRSSLFPVNEVYCDMQRSRLDVDDNPGCYVSYGVGYRKSRANKIEGVRLCGCPDADVGGDGIVCNEDSDFYVPLGILALQECITNDHCMQNLFAYCIGNSCGGFGVTALTGGMKFYQCVALQSCDITADAAQFVTETFKIVPVENQFSCGGEAALDPNYFDEVSQPCVLDIDGDDKCDVNLGVRAVTGQQRLCGCSGQDLGGDGIPCNQLEDFDGEIGQLTIGECVMNSDCADNGPGLYCFGGVCQADTFPPYVEFFSPGNGSYAVPPVHSITFEWNENVDISDPRKRIMVESLTNPEQSWVITVGRPDRFQLVELFGFQLTLRPDLSLRDGLPEGVYRVYYESRLVRDTAGNENTGRTDYYFSVSKNAGCPFLYLTGFFPGEDASTGPNPNGLFVPIEPVSGKAAWKGASPNNKGLFIYWKPEEGSVQANWLLDTNTEPSQFLGYADLQVIRNTREKQRPPSGYWKKWVGSGWLEQPVNFQCRDQPDNTPPTLVDINPGIGSVDFPVNGTIELTFNEPVFYGHGGAIRLHGRYSGQELEIWPDVYEDMREKYFFADGTNVVKIRPPLALFYGDEYEISVDIGAIVDSAYNPWGPVSKGTLKFRAYGVPCLEYPLPDPSTYSVSGTGRFHGAQREHRCASGLSPPSSQEEPWVIECENGGWQNLELQCLRDCPPFLDLGSMYKVDNPGSFHDAVLTLECANNHSPLQGSSPQTIRCKDGLWDIVNLRCGPDCGPFPSLGDEYALSGSGIGPGSSRTVRCARGSMRVKGSEPETVMCEDGRWDLPVLECRKLCQDYPSGGINNAVIEGEGLQHGDTRTLTCRADFVNTKGEDSVTSTCESGQWTPVDFECVPACPDYNPGPGYVIGGEETGKRDGSQRTIRCKEDAERTAGPIRDEVVCLRGAWSLKAIECMAACSHPSEGDRLGAAYDLVAATLTDPRMLHGAVGQLICTEEALYVTGDQPELVICEDGAWVPVGVQTGGGNKPRPDLVCKAPCGPPELDEAFAVVNVAESTGHGSALTAVCSDGFTPADGSVQQQMLICDDGTYIPEPANFRCNAGCSEADLEWLFNPEAYELDPSLGSVESQPDGSQRTVTCREGTFNFPDLPRTEITVCRDGFWTRTNVLCQFPQCDDGFQNGQETGVDCGGECGPCPTCTDGLQNGEELGVDCGGGCPNECAPTCDDGILNGQESTVDCGGVCGTADCPSCADREQNGDEEGVDCGGQCRGCRSCPIYEVDKLPPEMMAWPTDARQISHGAKRTIMCGPRHFGFTTTEQGQKISLPSQTIMCNDGAWDQLRLECEQASCRDKQKNGDEEDIDCGGSCDQPCNTCEDGVWNGDETNIDCGGSCPSPCPPARCNLVPIKLLEMHPAYTVTSLTSASLIDPRKIGTRYTVECAPGASLVSGPPVLEVECQNGRFTPDLSGIKCSSPGDASLKPGSTRTELFGQSAEDASCSLQTEDPSNSCCAFRGELRGLMESGCANQIFSEDQGQVQQFCSETAGSCVSRMRDLVNKYVGRTGTACDDVVHGRRALESFCNFKDGKFCFAEFGSLASTMTIQAVAGMSAGQLQNVCGFDSCFRSNLAYFDAVSKMNAALPLSAVRRPARGTRRRMQEEFGLDEEVIDFFFLEVPLDIEFFIFDEEPMTLDGDLLFLDLVNFDIEGEGEKMEGSGWNEKMTPLDLSDPQSASPFPFRRDDTLPPLDDFGKDLLKMFDSITKVPPMNAPKEVVEIERRRRRRRLQDVSAGNLGLFRSGPEAYGRLTRPVFETMCSKSPESQNYCASTVFDVVRGNPPLHSSADACADECLPHVSRDLGQLLISQGTAHGLTTGHMLMAFGRFFCQDDGNGQCGPEFFPDMSDALPRPRALVPASEDLIDCPAACKSEFVGDGECDDVCYVEGCHWDMGDCTMERAYPLVAAEVAGALGRTKRREVFYDDRDTCSVFHPDFQCMRGDLKTKCHTRVSALVNEQKCCAAAAYEIERVRIQFEMEMAALRQQKGTREDPETFRWRADRSLFQIENDCDLVIDRSCGGGGGRKVVKVAGRIANLNFKRLEPNTDLLNNRLIRAFRERMAATAAVPLADVTAVTASEGSLILEATIDPGSSAAQYVSDRLLQKRASGELLEVFVDSVNEADGLGSSGYKFDSNMPLSVADSSLSVRTVDVTGKAAGSPQTPDLAPIGALGVDDPEFIADSAPCGSQLGLYVPLGFSEGQVYSYTVPSSDSATGATVSVSCGPGYSVAAGSDPQTLTCNQNGIWVPPPGQANIKCVSRCSEPDFGGSLVIAAGGVSEGDVRTATCAEGLQSDQAGPVTFQCINGQWQTPALTCTGSVEETSEVHCNKDDLRNKLDERYVMSDDDSKNSDIRHSISCAAPFSSLNRATNALSECTDGQWSEGFKNELACILLPVAPGLTAGEIAGIVIGSVVGVILIGLLVWWWLVGWSCAAVWSWCGSCCRGGSGTPRASKARDAKGGKEGPEPSTPSLIDEHDNRGEPTMYRTWATRTGYTGSATGSEQTGTVTDSQYTGTVTDSQYTGTHTDSQYTDSRYTGSQTGTYTSGTGTYTGTDYSRDSRATGRSSRTGRSERTGDTFTSSAIDRAVYEVEREDGLVEDRRRSSRRSSRERGGGSRRSSRDRGGSRSDHRGSGGRRSSRERDRDTEATSPVGTQTIVTDTNFTSVSQRPINPQWDGRE
uniref:Sushi domain-containing protein n=1 Tax=Chromera velia CCMP2878 TaxID=1169474 RepID=A0A0G4HS72_9ALVE|eukprot:Cvel_8234.t1-p1 / transcript=Cvel_8234.t1 / gene=Cvel_8234 / organism=Chromera_velia_CCMP2878 / gene_product=Complement factor H, putative / transcript_product=Complement factor H, putative / location=Cvel_scaffold450:10860-23564(+) / protein_length=3097 / sequence_SO=supercontig / SO=protein_coding / is_pseudo=false